MIGDLFFACPRCGCFHCVEGDKRGTECTRCAAQFERNGFRVRVGETERPAWEWYDDLVARLDGLPAAEGDFSLEDGEHLLARSERGQLRRPTHCNHFTGFSGIAAPVEQLQLVGTCVLYLTDRRFVWQLEERQISVPHDEVACVTTDAREFVFRRKGDSVWHVEFPNQSPLFWELLSQRVLRDYWSRRGREVIEFQPWVRFRDLERPVRRDRLLVDEVRSERPKDSPWNEFVYSALRFLVRRLFRLVFGLELHGAENLPERGPFILIVNHEGYLDSFFVLAALPVKIGFLAKNTEFKNPINRWAMRVFRSVPVHRHRPDPVALRNVIRLLRKGAPVAVFPEGERTWDGRRLKPKRTTVKLLLRAGVPIVPCRIDGSFAVMPRWDHRLQRHKVRIWVGRPFRIPEEIRDLDEAIVYVGQRIDELGTGA